MRSRRGNRVVRLALAAVTAGLLAASCGGGRVDEPASPGATRDALGVGEGAVSIIAWAGYVERGDTDKGYDWVTGFERDSGCKVSVKVAATSDEMVALMNEGGFDLVTASGDASLRLISGGRVQPINTALVPGWNRLDPRLERRALAYRWRQALRRAVPVGIERADVQHNGLSAAANQLERRVRGDDLPGSQVEPRPGAGIRRPDLRGRRGALSQASSARAGNRRIRMPSIASSSRQPSSCSGSSGKSWAATGTMRAFRWTTS